MNAVNIIKSRLNLTSLSQAGLWILGEYCTSESQIRNMVDAVLESIGDLPIVDTEIREVQERLNHSRTQFLLFSA